MFMTRVNALTQSPCVSAPASPPECTTADACRAPSAPQPSIFGVSGEPDVLRRRQSRAHLHDRVGEAEGEAVDARAEARRRVEGVQKKKPKKKRSACERQARKQYGAPESEEDVQGGQVNMMLYRRILVFDRGVWFSPRLSLLGLVVGLPGACRAADETASWWHLESSATPTNLTPGRRRHASS